MTENVEMSAGQTLSFLRRPEPDFKWEPCPSCGEEWSKLHECVFYEGKETVKVPICVECAETVKGLDYVAGLNPIFGATINPVRMPTYKKMPLWRSCISEVRCGGDSAYSIGSEGMGVFLLKKGDDFEKRRKYVNLIQAWIVVKKELEEPTVNDTTDSWASSERRIGNRRRVK